MSQKKACKVVAIQRDETKMDLVAQMVAEKLNLDDKLIASAFKEWSQIHRAALDNEIPEEKVLHQIESDEVKSALVKVHIAKIESGAAKQRLKIAEQREDLAEKSVLLAIIEHEDVDSNQDWRVDIHRSLLLEPTSQAKDFAKLVEFCVNTAKLSEDALKTLRDDGMPSEMQENISPDGVDVTDFISDLAGFIIEAGNKGRELIALIGTDLEAAEKGVADDQMPKPVRFLAKIAAEVLKAAESE